MKQKLLSICAATLLFAACNSDEKTADSKMDESKKDSSNSMTSNDNKMEEKKSDNTYTMPDSATMMKDWQAYATPGEAHKMMAKSNGTWNAAITFWDKPGGPAQMASGTSVNKMVMGGRYQVSNVTSKMMGMPFEGMGTVAYDNAKKKMISTWIDNMGTGIMTVEGPWNESTHSATLTGKEYDISAKKDLDYKEVFTVVDDNTQTLEMYKPAPDGKEFKCMEIKYTRKK